MHTYIRTYVHTYIHTHIYIYIYICMWAHVARWFQPTRWRYGMIQPVYIGDSRVQISPDHRVGTKIIQDHFHSLFPESKHVKDVQTCLNTMNMLGQTCLNRPRVIANHELVAVSFLVLQLNTIVSTGSPLNQAEADLPEGDWERKGHVESASLGLFTVCKWCLVLMFAHSKLLWPCEVCIFSFFPAHSTLALTWFGLGDWWSCSWLTTQRLHVSGRSGVRSQWQSCSFLWAIWRRGRWPGRSWF